MELIIKNEGKHFKRIKNQRRKRVFKGNEKISLRTNKKVSIM